MATFHQHVSAALAEVSRNLNQTPEFQAASAAPHSKTAPLRSQELGSIDENTATLAGLPSALHQRVIPPQLPSRPHSAHSTPVARKRPRSRSSVSAASPSVNYAALNGLSAGNPKYVAACFPANAPCEDRHFFVYDADKEAAVFGVLDGHGGDACSEHAVTFLPDAVLSALTRAGGKGECRSALTSALAECEVDWVEHLKRMACMDKEVSPSMSICEQDRVCRDIEARAALAFAAASGRHRSGPGAGGHSSSLPPGFWFDRLQASRHHRLAKSGACATIGIIKNGFVVLAHVGDCRAVLATRSADRARASAAAADNLFMVHHTAENAAETSEVFKEHAPPEALVYREVGRSMAGRSDHLRPSAAQQLLARSHLPCTASGAALCEGFGLQAVALTEDHNYENERERLAVAHRQALKRKLGGAGGKRRGVQSDDVPFRRSQREQSAGIHHGPLRVAGLVSMTRALGDVYLKHPEWSTPYTRCAPYITATPQVTAHPVSEADMFLVLGSDGIFDRLSNQDVVDAVLSPELVHSLQLDGGGARPAVGGGHGTPCTLQRSATVGGGLQRSALPCLPPSLLSQRVSGGVRRPPPTMSPAGRPQPSKLARSASEPGVSRNRSVSCATDGREPVPPHVGGSLTPPLALGEGLPNGIGLTSAHMGSGELTPLPADDDEHSIASSWAAATCTDVPLRKLLSTGALARRREVHDDLTAMVVLLPASHGPLLEIANRPKSNNPRQQRSIRDFVRPAGGVPRGAAEGAPPPVVPCAAAGAVSVSGGPGGRRRRGGAAQVQRARELVGTSSSCTAAAAANDTGGS